MAYKIQIGRKKIRNDLVNAGFDLNKKVSFWGRKITLSKAINLFDKDDISDAKRMIDDKKKGLPLVDFKVK